MKTTAYSFYLTILVLITLQSEPVRAGTFIADACWLVTEVEPEPGSDVIIKLGVTDLGGGHYGFDGYASSAYFGNSPQIMSGNGEIIGDQVVIALTGVMSNPLATISYYTRINLSDLNGSYDAIGTFRDPSSVEKEAAIEIFSGTLSPTDCPT